MFGGVEREHFRILMRMQENFSGCRVLSYCIMSNHFHILLEVPSMPESGISDVELLKRLAAAYNDAFVTGRPRNWRKHGRRNGRLGWRKSMPVSLTGCMT